VCLRLRGPTPQGWAHVDEVTRRGCGGSALEIRRLVKRMVRSGLGRLSTDALNCHSELTLSTDTLN
jgi:hypothetical protein